jgi:hypothetical protein
MPAKRMREAPRHRKARTGHPPLRKEIAMTSPVALAVLAVPTLGAMLIVSTNQITSGRDGGASPKVLVAPLLN